MTIAIIILFALVVVLFALVILVYERLHRLEIMKDRVDRHEREINGAHDQVWMVRTDLNKLAGLLGYKQGAKQPVERWEKIKSLGDPSTEGREFK